MPTKKIRILSAAVAGGLVFTGVTAAVITGHAPAHAALAANMASSPPVNLDNCPILTAGYHGGCVNQLQTELNAANGTNIPVDGIFGPQTRDAVRTFQENHHIVPADGKVGPQTKAVLDNLGLNSAAALTPGASTASPAPDTSNGSGAASAAQSSPTPPDTPGPANPNPASAPAPSASTPYPSQGADDAVAISPGQDNCTDYSQGALWHTSTHWARVRYQPCLQESSDGRAVTPIIHVQFDWPVASSCSLSVGFPPSVSLGCPLTVLAKPVPKITFQAFTSYNSQPVDFEIPLETTRPDGLTDSSWCHYNPEDTSTNTSTYGPSIQNGGRITLTCNGPTYPRLIGTYTVGSLGPRGDVKDDGADARILVAGHMQFVSS